MWGESSKQCEVNCQCSGLITDSFTLNSSGSKRRRDEPQHGYKQLNRPLISPRSPLHTPKRRVLGELQNVPVSPFATELQASPITSRLLNTPFVKRSTSKLTRVFEERTRFRMSNKENRSHGDDLENRNVDFDKLQRRSLAFAKLESENLAFTKLESENIAFTKLENENIAFTKLENENIAFTKLEGDSLTFTKRGKLSFTKSAGDGVAFAKSESGSMSFTNLEGENMSFTKLENENIAFTDLGTESMEYTKEESQSLAFTRLDSEETRDSAFSDSFETSLGLQRSKTVKNWTLAKMTPPQPERNFSPKSVQKPVFGLDLDLADSDMETLHDLDAEFDNDNFESCSKYEIISTDSPDIISKGRTDSRKITAKNLTEFGAPLAEVEQSTSFNLKPVVSATRMLNFEEEFAFTSPENFKRVTQKEISVKKSLKFSGTPTKTFLRHESSCSSIGSMSMSPLSSKLSLCTSESTASMESGFISELDEQFIELEDNSNSPKVANFNDLLSGRIKQDFGKEAAFVLKRPALQRSMSCNQEANKVRVSLFEEKRSFKRHELRDDFRSTKRKRSNCENISPLAARPQERPIRPTLQRALSENAASIMSALARSASEPDLIGDFSQPCALPVTTGDHTDLKSISCETLAALLRGDYKDIIREFQVIDCRYPYEYQGGHIKGARNLYTQEMVLTLMDSPPSPGAPGGSPRGPGGSPGGPQHPPGAEKSPGRKVLLFHCEFSLERGPKLSRYLRSADRARNADNYPSLRYPEVYLLHGGYAAFHLRHSEYCEPTGYTAMLDPRHKHSLRQARSMK